ncbi:hypothetical protein Ancab_000565 [Ancistrocladus abbreviatus]
MLSLSHGLVPPGMLGWTETQLNPGKEQKTEEPSPGPPSPTPGVGKGKPPGNPPMKFSGCLGLASFSLLFLRSRPPSTTTTTSAVVPKARTMRMNNILVTLSIPIYIKNSHTVNSLLLFLLSSSP